MSTDISLTANLTIRQLSTLHSLWNEDEPITVHGSQLDALAQLCDLGLVENIKANAIWQLTTKGAEVAKAAEVGYIFNTARAVMDQMIEEAFKELLQTKGSDLTLPDCYSAAHQSLADLVAAAGR